MSPDLFESLAKLRLSSGEYRLVLYIVARTLLDDKASVALTYEEIMRNTYLGKCYIGRLTGLLKDRGIIKVTRYKKTLSYSVELDANLWKPKNVAEGTPWAKYHFKTWFKRYPNKVYKGEAMACYLSLLNNGVKVGELEDALTGYLNYIWIESLKPPISLPEEWDAMYPTSFLKREAYKRYLRYKNIKKAEVA